VELSASTTRVAALPSTVTPVRLVPVDSSPAHITTNLLFPGAPISKAKLVPVTPPLLTKPISVQGGRVVVVVVVDETVVVVPGSLAATIKVNG